MSKMSGCDCVNIDIQSYDNQVMHKSWWSDKMICIDKCIEDEILFLWSNKIVTTGCCCGHNKLEPFIQVDSNHHLSMIKLGYKFYVNDFGAVLYKSQTIKIKSNE